MKITKTRLKKIIQEVTLKEIHSTVEDPLELVQAALGVLGELSQLIDNVGEQGINPTLRETLKAHIATASRHLEGASTPMMPRENVLEVRAPHPVGSRVKHKEYGEGVVTHAGTKNTLVAVKFDKKGGDGKYNRTVSRQSLLEV